MDELITITVEHEPEAAPPNMIAVAGLWMPYNPVSIHNPATIHRGSVTVIPATGSVIAAPGRDT